MARGWKCLRCGGAPCPCVACCCSAALCNASAAMWRAAFAAGRSIAPAGQRHAACSKANSRGLYSQPPRGKRLQTRAPLAAGAGREREARIRFLTCLSEPSRSAGGGEGLRPRPGGTLPDGKPFAEGWGSPRPPLDRHSRRRVECGAVRQPPLTSRFEPLLSRGTAPLTPWFGRLESGLASPRPGARA